MRKEREESTQQERDNRWSWLLARLTPEMYASLYREALGLVGSHETAEDMTQEALLRAAERLEQLRKEEHLGCWLRAIVRRLSLDERKRAMRETAAQDRCLREELPYAPSAEEEAVRREGWERFHGALEHLNAASRQMMLLRLCEGLTFRQIASMSHASLSRVHACCQKATANVRAELASENAQEESTQSRGHTV